MFLLDPGLWRSHLKCPDVRVCRDPPLASCRASRGESPWASPTGMSVSYRQRATSTRNCQCYLRPNPALNICPKLLFRQIISARSACSQSYRFGESIIVNPSCSADTTVRCLLRLQSFLSSELMSTLLHPSKNKIFRASLNRIR